MSQPDYDVAVVGGGNAALVRGDRRATCRRPRRRPRARAAPLPRREQPAHAQLPLPAHKTRPIPDRHLHRRRVPLGPAQCQRRDRSTSRSRAWRSSSRRPARSGWRGGRALSGRASRHPAAWPHESLLPWRRQGADEQLLRIRRASWYRRVLRRGRCGSAYRRRDGSNRSMC